VSVAALLVGAAGQLQTSPAGPHAAVVELDTIIHPISQRFLSKALDTAAEEGATVVVVEIDTPGGLLNSTRDMVGDIFASTIPVIVYVSPAGSRAASAGTFITAAGHIAAMAPGTNIGAASPISGSGEDIPETLKEKIFEDAAAEIRSIAERRGRSIEALEATVLEAKAYSATEALELGIIDLIVDSIPELLREIDGRVVSVRTEAGPMDVTLETAGLEVRHISPGFFEKLLSFIADPNISFLLLSLGGLGIFVEILSPGLIFPGVGGLIALLLAFFALGNLPGNWAGVALILLAFALAVAEVTVAGFGVLGILGYASFILGGIILFGHYGTPSPTFPDIEVSKIFLIPVSVVVGAGGGGLMLAVVQSRRRQKRLGKGSLEMVGLVGVASTEITATGTVHVRGETWNAEAVDGTLVESGEQVVVVKETGAVLTVRRADDGVEAQGEALEGEEDGTPRI